MFSLGIPHRQIARLLGKVQGSALLEFAIVLPLLVVFVVGIYDFSDALNRKQKIQQAAQEAAIIAGSQPTSDIQSMKSNPASLQVVVDAVFNSLTGSGVLAKGACSSPGQPTPGPTWVYMIGCNGATDNLVIKINRAWICGSSPPPPCPAAPPCPSGPPIAVGTSVAVTYPYHWRLFGSAIQLLFPGQNSYSAPTQLTACASVHNQI